ncbi:hypothetical protein AB4Z01_04655 [Inquilinus sp. YAF38]|uniref:hypothetical protein n=1 Tax=Inquilinus sp. YAF38 TaxID=3233084 RepID=UPI003F8D9C55
MSGESSDPFGPAKDNLRDTIKWLATTMGALAAAVVAGVSLSGLLEVEGWQRLVALGGAAAGVLGISAIVVIFLGLLMSRAFSLSLLESSPALQRLVEPVAVDILPAEYSTLKDFLDFRGKALKAARTHRFDTANPDYVAATDFLTKTDASLGRIVSFGHFEMMSQRLRGGAPYLIGWGLFALAGLVVFALFAGGKPVPSGPSAVLPVELAPGKAWADLGQAFTGACGDVAALKAEIVGVPQPGWLTLKLLAPEGCAGLSLDVPARVTASPAAAIGVPAPAGR